MKRFLYLIFALIPVLSLWGCKPSGQGAGETRAQETAAPTEEPTAATEAPTELPTEMPTEVPTEAPTEPALADGSYSVFIGADSYYEQDGELWAEVAMAGYVIMEDSIVQGIGPGSVIVLTPFGLEDIPVTAVTRYDQENYIELNDGEYLLQPYRDSDRWILTYPYNDLAVTYVSGYEKLPIAPNVQVIDDTAYDKTPIGSPLDFFDGTIYADYDWPSTITVSGGRIISILYEYRP